MTKQAFRRIKAVAWKEFIQIKRDPRSLGLSLVIPVFLLLIFGYGLSLDIDHVRTVVWNQDASSELTRNFLLNFKNSRYFRIVKYTDNYRDIERMINKGEVLMALIIPKDFSHYIESGKQAPLQLLIDGSDANTATIARGYVYTVVSKYNVGLLTQSFADAGLKAPESADARSRVWFNMGLTSTWFIVPGVIAIIIMIIAALVTSICVAREWERGTMEQLISTPVKAPELVIGKFIPYFAIGFFDLMVGVIMARFLFQVPFRGSYLLLILLSSLFLTGALSQGILISVVARTQLMASQLASLTTMIPAMLLSGFIYPIFNMPQFLQAVTYLIPARYYIVILRESFLKGGTMRTMWDEALFLLLFAFIMLFLAVTRFKKKVAV
ncbi:MAG: ABC transporter permease [Candidatus Omnitrophota bacterium]